VLRLRRLLCWSSVVCHICCSGRVYERVRSKCVRI
jgi:hypothetical protein